MAFDDLHMEFCDLKVCSRRRQETDSGISNDRCKITVVRAFARNKKKKFISTVLWKFTSASDGKNKDININIILHQQFYILLL